MPAKHTKNASGQNRVRIIGGRYRGRMLAFNEDAQLRPTPDRVRETLFNWLQADIHQARCLDMFSGSGALAIEAISRGAAFVLALETNPKTLSILQQQLERFSPCEVQLKQVDALEFLKTNTTADTGFDIIFVDPPYQHYDLVTVLQALADSEQLASGAKIYFESNRAVDAAQLPADWALLKQKKAGQVHYYLAQAARLAEDAG